LLQQDLDKSHFQLQPLVLHTLPGLPHQLGHCGRPCGLHPAMETDETRGKKEKNWDRRRRGVSGAPAAAGSAAKAIELARKNLFDDIILLYNVYNFVESKIMAKANAKIPHLKVAFSSKQ